MSPTELSNSDAERLRAFERQGHDALAKSYRAFFSAVTALATNPLLDAVRLRPGGRNRLDLDQPPRPHQTAHDDKRTGRRFDATLKQRSRIGRIFGTST